MAGLKCPWTWREDVGELTQSGPGCAAGLAQGMKATAASIANVSSLQERHQTERNITLEDVKAVAVTLVSEVALLSSPKQVAPLFDQCYRTEQLNCLLWSSLMYYDSYQLHCDAASADALSGSKVSKTCIDQNFFEILYEFLMLSVWICFGYEHWEDIRKELGRVFRTSAFNRDYSPSQDGESAKIDGLGTVSKTSDEYLAYRVHYERPPVGTLRCLRSPALETIMPPQRGKASTCTEGWLCPMEIPKELGIIGKKLADYDPHNLKVLSKGSQLKEESSDRDSDSIPHDHYDIT